MTSMPASPRGARARMLCLSCWLTRRFLCRAITWLTLTNALSGLFCASLNFIDGTRTTRPVMSFQPRVTATRTRPRAACTCSTASAEGGCVHGEPHALSQAAPCKGKAGIACSLDGHKLFDASWQSMAIDVRPVCPPGGECVLEIEQTIDMVLDIERSKRPRGTSHPACAARAAWDPFDDEYLTMRLMQITPFPGPRPASSSSATPRSPTTVTTPASPPITAPRRTGRCRRSLARP